MASLSQFTDNELLARILQAEAGNQGLAGLEAVASVVNNRVASPNYPNTFRGVLTQPGQFSPTNYYTGYANGEQGVNLASLGVSDLTNQVAARALAGEVQDAAGGAVNFVNPDISNPSWYDPATFKKIGDHAFGTASGGGAGRVTMSTSNSQVSPEVLAGETPRGKTVASGFRGVIRGLTEGNPTQDPAMYDRFADLQRRGAERSREAFNSNAPASWMNVLASGVQDAGALYADIKAGNTREARNERIASLTGVDAVNMSDQQIAEISALDPELGAQLRSERRSAITRQEDIRREDMLRAEDRRNELADREWEANREDRLTEEAREWEIERTEIQAEIGAQSQEIERYLASQDLEPGTQEYRDEYRRIYELGKAKSSSDSRTSIEKNLQAAGYVPGTRAYQDAMKAQLDSTQSPEVLAAQAAAEAAARGNNEFSKIVGKESGLAAVGLTTSARTSAAQLPQWEAARVAMNDFRGGTLAPTMQGVGQFLSSIGISDQDLEDYGIYNLMSNLGVTQGQAMSMETVERVVNEAIIGKIGSGGTEGGFPANNFSNADLEFLKTSVPGLTNTDGGMRAKLTFLEWRDKANIAKASAWNERLNDIYNLEKRQPNPMDWQNFDNNWRNNAANLDLQEDMKRSLVLDRITTGGVISPKTQEEMDMIPSGEYFRNPADGKIYRKN